MNIWFNHWFSSAYHYMESLKKSGNRIIVSNERESCIHRAIADEFHEDIPETDSLYAEWAFGFAKRHQIDLFFVKRGMGQIIDKVMEFESNGIKTICPHDKSLFDIMQDKSKTYEYMKERLKYTDIKIPDYQIVSTLDEFEKAFDDLGGNDGRQLCIKYNIDEGGQSYKLVSPRKPRIGRISENNGLTYTYQYIADCMATCDRFQEIMVMPYLEGPEISIDCITTPFGVTAVSRHKLSNRVTKVAFVNPDDRLIAGFQGFSEESFPFNIQYRMHNGDAYLLEMNPRLSGGAWKASYIGIDFAKIALCCATRMIDSRPKPTTNEVSLGNLENCIIL